MEDHAVIVIPAIQKPIQLIFLFHAVGDTFVKLIFRLAIHFDVVNGRRPQPQLLLLELFLLLQPPQL